MLKLTEKANFVSSKTLKSKKGNEFTLVTLVIKEEVYTLFDNSGFDFKELSPLEEVLVEISITSGKSLSLALSFVEGL